VTADDDEGLVPGRDHDRWRALQTAPAPAVELTLRDVLLVGIGGTADR
jgi:hypothetical protein